MNVWNVISHFISNILIGCFSIYCWKTLSSQVKIDKKKECLLIILLAIVSTIVGVLFENPLKLMINIVFLMFVCDKFIVKDLKKSVTFVIISQAILIVSESVYALIASLFIKDVVTYIKDPMKFLFMNIYIVLLSFLLMQFKRYKNIINKVNVTSSYLNRNEAVTFSIITILIMIIATVESYMHLPFQMLLITNAAVTIVFIMLVLKLTGVKAEYKKVNKKYKTSMKSLKEYENMLTKYKKAAHENKNELQRTRNMIKGDENQEVIRYLDGLIKQKIKYNEEILKKTFKIPEGGLRATIYSKLCEMENQKIDYKLDIASDVKASDLINLDEDIMLNVYSVLAVFLDNAIEAVKDLKEKNIEIEIYIMDNKLCIDISNNYEGVLELDKISKLKYTTKGKGHGYGLPLVDDIISKNSKYLENEKSISGNTFTQTLKINYKK